MTNLQLFLALGIPVLFNAVNQVTDCSSKSQPAAYDNEISGTAWIDFIELAPFVQLCQTLVPVLVPLKHGGKPPLIS